MGMDGHGIGMDGVQKRCGTDGSNNQGHGSNYHQDTVYIGHTIDSMEGWSTSTLSFKQENTKACMQASKSYIL